MFDGTANSNFYGGKASTDILDICKSGVTGEDTKIICNNNEGTAYKSLTELAADTYVQKYTYNQWYLRNDYWELHLTCSTYDVTKAVCGAVET